MKITFRCDGGIDIGMGHLVRCTALAKALIKNSHEVNFLTKDNPLSQTYFTQNKLSFQLIPDNITQDDEIDLLTAGSDFVIIDTYSFSEHYLQKIEAKTKTCLFLDTPTPVYLPVDIALMPHDLNPLLNTDPHTHKLYGHDYIILRSEFAASQKKIDHAKELNNTLVTFGGSDSENVTVLVAKLLKKYNRKLNIHFMLGAGYALSNKNELTTLMTNTHHEVHYHHNIQDVASLMLTCDMAIAPPSVTAYELANLGIPTLLIRSADNQKLVEKNLEKTFLPLGYFGDINEDNFLQAMHRMEQLEYRKQMGEAAIKLVDGQGTQRVADVINRLVKPE